jgi:pyrimidine-nucleoside phosphorylase
MGGGRSASFSAADIIGRKQAGKALSRSEIFWFINASATGEIPDYQVAAFLMAVFFRGMTLAETRDLTAAMIGTGTVLKLKSIHDIKVDKHSTGGVGDKISLILGPLVASVGVHVPMVSGRALGHTGGTLDKLESIPGFKTGLSARRFEKVVKSIGISIIGQTDEIAPADRKFYAIRDVTSTVACRPLMVGSILSKKIASGADAVVFDIKCGEGAFMKKPSEARDLARLLSSVASMLGIKTTTLLTRMDEPLGCFVGNALEVREVIEVLKGKWVEDLIEVSLALGSEMLLLAGKAKRRSEAYTLLRSALLGGKALQKFEELIKAQGGDPRVIDDPGRLPAAKFLLNVRSTRRGYVSDIDAFEVGRIATMLGAGRLKKGDSVDPAVGIEFLKKSGGWVERGEAIARIHASDRSAGRRYAGLLRKAISLSSKKPPRRRLVIGRVTSKGIVRGGR